MRHQEALEVNELVKAVGMRHRARATQLLGELGLNMGQEQILLELDRTGPRTQSQLAAATSYEPPTVTLAVRKLEAAGLVSRAQSPSDARMIVVGLTDLGRALMPRVRSAWRKLAAETVSGLTPAERADLTLSLRRLLDNLVDSPPPA